MSLIDNDEIHIHLLHIAAEHTGPEPLWRYIEELEVTVCGIVEDKFHLTPAHTGIHAKGLDPSVVEILDLILHQCDKRSHDQSYAGTHHCRDLKTHRFSASSGKNGKYILTLQSSFNDIKLLRTKGIIPPIFF